MSFDWTDYLALARQLNGDSSASPSTEAKQRAAISRAYYAAFHVCLGKLGTRIPAYQNSHLAVVDYFVHNQNATYKDIGSRLNRLLQDRRKADYEDSVPSLDWLTPKAVENAAAIVELVNRL